MNKILQLGDRFPTGEPVVQSVLRELRNGSWAVEKTAFDKTASPALDYIRGVTPEAGSTYVLVNALGAYETYGCNRNGDAFPARPYKLGVPAPGAKSSPLDGWVTRDEVLPRHYVSFEQAGIFEHHLNKDISRSLGNVVRSFWNERMQRVELLLKLVNSRKPELIQRINDGEYPAVSMGCKVRWDVCTYCGNRAPTRKEYCEHLAFHLREVSPFGLVYCALNPSPFFFDISFVVRPADQTGYMLKKVAEDRDVLEVWSKSAELGEQIAAFNEKQAVVRKVGDIQKQVVDGVVEGVRTPEQLLIEKYRSSAQPTNVQGLPPAGATEMETMGEYPLSTVLGTLAKHGAFLATGELATLLCKKAGYAPTSQQLDRVVLAQPAVLESLALYPALLDKLGALVPVDPAKADARLARKLGSWLEKRSSVFEAYRQKFHEPSLAFDGAPMGPGYLYNAQAPAKTDVLTMTDPHTGQVYKTTRGASQLAGLANVRSLIGGTALLGGAYTLGLGMIPGVKQLPLAARAALGGLGGYATTHALMTRVNAPYRHLQYQTDQGPVVAGNTEFVKSSTLLLDKLAFDYVERLGRWPSGALDAALAARAGRVVGREKIAAVLYPYETAAVDAIAPPHLSIHRLSDVFGAVVTPPR